jgi:hypothetical protein
VVGGAIERSDNATSWLDFSGTSHPIVIAVTLIVYLSIIQLPINI